MTETDLSGPLMLNPSVSIVPVRNYPEAIRVRLGGSPDDYILSERRSRYAATRIDAEAARFLRRLEQPRSLAEAIVEHGADRGENPQDLLTEIISLVVKLRAQRVLVPPFEAGAAERPARFGPGDEIGPFAILDVVDIGTETEIYRVRTAGGEEAALKWRPHDAPDFVHDAVSREDRMLDRLRAAGFERAPRKLGTLELEDGSALVIDWLSGRDLLNVSRDRSLGLPDRLRIARALLEAYGDLHARGFLHGDVHGRNAMVSREGTVTLIDFGAATALGESVSSPRVGLLPEYEPEAARAALAEATLPPPSPAGEQYAVAGLVTLLVTGAPPLLLPLEAAAALRAICDDPPRPWRSQGVEVPALERVVRWALAKAPSDRFPDFAAFIDAALEAVDALPAASVTDTPARLPEREGPDLVARIDEAWGLRSAHLRDGLPYGPTASIYYGAAGIALALLRVALIHQDGGLLAAAEAWARRATADMDSASAFEGPEIGLDPKMTGPVSVLNAAPGAFYAEALVAVAFEDAAWADRATRDFVLAAERSDRDDGFALDLANGAPGLLLAATTLHGHREALSAETRSALERVLNSARARTAAALSEWSSERRAPAYLGVAHGVAGCALALLRDAEARRGPVDPVALSALDRLAGSTIRQSDGASWHLEDRGGNAQVWLGWCHGSAGHAMVWLEAARQLGCDASLERGLQAAEFVWSRHDAAGPNSSLCCGRAGQALACLAAGDVTGNGVWVDRARKLLAKARDEGGSILAPHSLFRGDLGPILAAIEAEASVPPAFPLLTDPF